MNMACVRLRNQSVVIRGGRGQTKARDQYVVGGRESVDGGVNHMVNGSQLIVVQDIDSRS